MTTNGAPQIAEAETRAALKRAARRLFAERGFRDVTVREIAQAAGQRNLGIVSYYFATKENLACEILADGAQRIEARRNAFLDALEEDSGPRTIAEVIEAIVLPSAQFSDEDGADGAHFNGFLLQVSLSNASLIDKALEGRWNRGYQRCLRHLRRLMPDMPLAAKNRRFVFVGAYVSALLATRETMLSDRSRSHPTWRSDATLRDIVTTCTAIVAAPYAD